MEAQMGQLQEIRSLLGLGESSQMSPLEVKKALTAVGGGAYATSYAGLLLEREAKILLPVFAGMRNRTPVDTPERGAEQVQYKAELGFGTFDFAGAMGSDEAAIGSDFTGKATEKQ